MNDHDLAILITEGCALYVEITDGELRVRRPMRARPFPRFRYRKWIEDADAEGWESVDVYVKYKGELLWAGEILDGLGIAPFLRSRKAMLEYAQRHRPGRWDGFCRECTCLYGRNHRLVSLGGGAWECPECGAVEHHEDAPPAHGSQVSSILEGLLDSGLPEYREHILSCMEVN